MSEDGLFEPEARTFPPLGEDLHNVILLLEADGCTVRILAKQMLEVLLRCDEEALRATHTLHRSEAELREVDASNLAVLVLCHLVLLAVSTLVHCDEVGVCMDEHRLTLVDSCHLVNGCINSCQNIG